MPVDDHHRIRRRLEECSELPFGQGHELVAAQRPRDDASVGTDETFAEQLELNPYPADDFTESGHACTRS